MAVTPSAKAPKQGQKERGVKRPAKGKHDEGSRKKAKQTDKPAPTNGHKKPKAGVNGKPKHARPAKDADPDSDSDAGSDLDLAPSETSQSPEPPKKKARKLHPKPQPKQPEATNLSSRETHQKQKVVTRERREAKPHANALASGKQAWEALRQPNQSKEKERQNAVALLEQVSGRAADFVLKHDGARLFQSAWRHARPAERRGLVQELRGHFRAMAESSYGKHALDKVLSTADAETRGLIVGEFCGHVRGMIRHPHAGWALDDAYRGGATKAQKARLLREWYGTEYAVLERQDGAAETADLAELLAENPEKRTPVMRYLGELITLLVQKKTWRFEILHDAMLQYFGQLTPGTEEWDAFFDLLIEDDEPGTQSGLALVLSETRSGSRLLALAIARSPAKGRKLLVRKFKDQAEQLAGHENGHVPLMAALECTDDTVLTTKSIYGEIVAGWKSAAPEDGAPVAALQNRGVRALLLLPFAHKPSLVLAPPEATFLAELRAIRETTSKKDPAQRRRELAAFVAPPLLRAVTAFAPELLSQKFTALVVQEALLGCAPDSADLPAALAALVDLLVSEQQPDVRAAADSPSSLRALKVLVLAGWFNAAAGEVEPCEAPPGFAEMLAAAVLDQGGLVVWATGVRAFLVEALLRTKDIKAPTRARVCAALKEGRAQIEAKAAEDDGEGAKGVKAEAAKGKKGKKGDKGDKGEKVEKDGQEGAGTVGVRGARAVLAALDKE